MEDIHRFKSVRYAYATMVLSYSEIYGALVLAYSLKKQMVNNHIILLIYEGIDDDTSKRLEKVFDKVVRMSLIIPSNKMIKGKFMSINIFMIYSLI